MYSWLTYGVAYLQSLTVSHIAVNINYQFNLHTTALRRDMTFRTEFAFVRAETFAQ